MGCPFIWLWVLFSDTFSRHMDNNREFPTGSGLAGRPRAEPKIDHVGIAVNSLAEAMPRWSAILGSPPAGREDVESEGVRVAFFGEGPGRVELLEPLDPDSHVGRFLRRRGPGIHHVCLRVADLESALDRAEAEGGEAIEPRVRVGAGGGRVAFLHPRSSDGVLIELREVTEGP